MVWLHISYLILVHHPFFQLYQQGPLVSKFLLSYNSSIKTRVG
jgi:hypothetical protein